MDIITRKNLIAAFLAGFFLLGFVVGTQFPLFWVGVKLALMPRLKAPAVDAPAGRDTFQEEERRSRSQQDLWVEEQNRQSREEFNRENPEGIPPGTILPPAFTPPRRPASRTERIIVTGRPAPPPARYYVRQHSPAPRPWRPNLWPATEHLNGRSVRQR